MEAYRAASPTGGGADLVQGYSAFIYNGPAWPGKVTRALARRR